MAKVILGIVTVIFMVLMFIAPMVYILSALFSIGSLGFWEMVGVMLTSLIMFNIFDVIRESL